MRAILFIETTKNILRGELREDLPDIIKVYKADTFWSIVSDIKSAKIYSQVSDKRVNGCPNDNIKALTSYGYNMRRLYKDYPYKYKEIYKERSGSLLGYILVKNEDVSNKVTLHEDFHEENIIETVYTHQMELDADGNVEMYPIKKQIEREKRLKELLDNGK